MEIIEAISTLFSIEVEYTWQWTGDTAVPSRKRLIYCAVREFRMMNWEPSNVVNRNWI